MSLETAALFHQPESEYAYLYKNDRLFIRLRTKADDVKSVQLISGDPYLLHLNKWYQTGRPMKKIATTEHHDYWGIETTQPTKRVAYGFHVIGNDQTEMFYCDRGILSLDEKTLQEGNYYFRMPYFHEVDRFKAPDWVKETVWYQIFPERFTNGNPANDPANVLPWGSKEHPGHHDFYGGDLQGIIDKLDYLEDLGINGLYLNPIFEADTNHKYDTTNYKKIDPAFGDKKVLKELIDEAHRREMKVMLDAVFNHLGYFSKEWQDVLKSQENSQYKDWFHIHSFPVKPMKAVNGRDEMNYDTFAFSGNMPKLNTANPEVQAYLCEIAAYWIEEFDIDGWRLDVANEIDHHFWKKFHDTCINLKEDFYIVGEIWHSSQRWLEGDEFHAVMNYVFTETIEDYFINETKTPTELVHGLNKQLMLYRQQTNEVQFNLLDSHDTPRLLTKAGGEKDRMKAALTFMFVQQGTPCIFYGTEVGIEGGDDPDCRKCMPWSEADQDLDMYIFTKELIAFRKKFQSIISDGDYEWHDVRDDKKLIGFKRTLNNQELTFYFNQNDMAITIQTPTKAYPVHSYLSHAENNQIKIKKNGFFVYLNDMN